MNELAAKNHRFAGFAFLCVAAVFFATKMTTLAIAFLALGIVFIVRSTKRGSNGGQ